jgi:hypothetical protein
MRRNRELGLAVSALRRGTQKTPARATLLAITNPQMCLPPEPSRRGGSREEPRMAANRQGARSAGDGLGSAERKILKFWEQLVTRNVWAVETPGDVL